MKHNVPNCGYKITMNGEKIMYATDTSSLDGIGEYAYEYQVLKNHLSKKKCDEFLAKNAGINSSFIYLHTHAGIKYDY